MAWVVSQIRRSGVCIFRQDEYKSLTGTCIMLLVLALVPRLVYIGISGAHEIRRAEMERAAVSWADTGRIGDIYEYGTGDSAHVAPLYPVLLGTAYRIVGSTGQMAQLTQQILVTFATALGIALLPIVARRTGVGTFCGIIAAIGIALCPFNLWIETSGSWEQPYAVIALQAILICFALLHTNCWQSWKITTMTGVTIGVAALLSPTLLPVAGIIVIGEVFHHHNDLRRKLRHALVLTIVVASIIAPWSYRNFQVLGAFVPIRSNFGLELAIGNNDQATGMTPFTTGSPTSPGLSPLHPFSSDTEREKLKKMGEARYMASRMTEAITWIRHHPGQFLRLTIWRARLFWFPTIDLWNPSVLARQLRAIVICVISGCALAGIAILWARSKSFGLLHFGAMFGPSLVYLITHVDPRYRYIVMWNTTLLACYAIQAAWQLMTTKMIEWKNNIRS